MNDIPLGLIIFQEKTTYFGATFQSSLALYAQRQSEKRREGVSVPSVTQPVYSGRLTDEPRLRWEGGEATSVQRWKTQRGSPGLSVMGGGAPSEAET